MNLRTHISVLLAAIALSAAAQSLHESIQVEGRYVPEIIQRERIFSLPQLPDLSLPEATLDYSLAGVPASFPVWGPTMPPSLWQASKQWDLFPGYASLSLGSWLDSNLSAGYTWRSDDRNSSLGVKLQWNSTSLLKPNPEPFDQIKRKLYDGAIAIFGSHLFEGLGSVDASLFYHGGYFNYYGQPADPVPTQTLYHDGGEIGWKSVERRSLTWHARFRAARFAYRQGDDETDLALTAGAYTAPGDGMRLGADLAASAFLLDTHDGLGNYGLTSLTPYFSIQRSSWGARVGARLDFQENARVLGRRQATFRPAPDCFVRYAAGSFSIALSATGGCEAQTLDRLAQLDPYVLPRIYATAPVYTPVDATLRIGFGPFSGCSIGVGAEYKVSKNQLLYNCEPALWGAQYALADIHGWSILADASVAVGPVTLAANGSYQPQKDAENGIFNGYDRPRWLLNASAKVDITKAIFAALEYDYRGVRNVFMPAADAGAYSASEEKLRLPDITMLSLRAGYRVSRALSISASLQNLLNHDFQPLPGLHTGGLAFSLGVNVKF